MANLATYCVLSGIAWATAAMPIVGQAANIVRATGTVEPAATANVTAPAGGGRVKRIGPDSADANKTITYGSHVAKNGILAELDSTIETIQVEQAKASLNSAEINAAMAKSQLTAVRLQMNRPAQGDSKKADGGEDLGKAGLDLAIAKFRIAEANMQKVRADLQLANAKAAERTIVSPIDGVVIDCRVAAGQSTSPNASLFVIANLDKLQVWAAVGEADINRVAVGQPVRLNLNAKPDKTFTGRVSEVRLNAQLTKNAVHYTVVIDVDNAKGLLPYQTADVFIDSTPSKK